MKTDKNGAIRMKKFLGIACLGMMLLFFQACKSEDAEVTTATTSANVATPSINMSLPTTLTGTASASASMAPGGVSYAEGGPSCNFDGNGSGDTDPFRNGHTMSRFLVSMTAQWMCFGDWMMTAVMAMGWPIDGAIQTIPEDADDPDSPTGISITQDSATQTTIRLYWNNETTTPGMFISWNTNGGTTTGRLVLGSVFMNDGGADANAPERMRMDFTIVEDVQQTADMFLSFPTASSAFTGFRTEVVKDLEDDSVIARAKMDMKAQYGSDAGMDAAISATPVYNVYTIADSAGAGAAIANMSDIGIGLDGGGVNQHLGYFLFTKTDKFFFNASGTSEYVNKAISPAVYVDGRTATTFLTNVETALTLPGGYFSGTCNATTTDCTLLFNTMFDDPNFGGQEQNSGTDPGDARSTTINAVTSTSYLSSVYPTGSTSWDGVFDMSFTP